MIINANSASEIELIVGTAISGAGGTKPTRTDAVAGVPAIYPVPASNVTTAVAVPADGATSAAVMVQVAVVAPARITIGEAQVVV